MSYFYNNFINNLNELQDIALAYEGFSSANFASLRITNDLVLEFLRAINPGYTRTLFNSACGKVDTGFINYVKANNSTLYNYFYDDSFWVNDPSDRNLDIPHLAVAIQGAIVSLTIPHMAEYISWAGDLATAMNDCVNRGADPETVVGNNSFSCGAADVRSDVDAMVIVDQFGDDIYSGMISVHDAFKNYYSSSYSDRYSLFIDCYGGTSRFPSKIHSITNDIILDWGLIDSGVTTEIQEAVTDGFIAYVNKHA